MKYHKVLKKIPKKKIIKIQKEIESRTSQMESHMKTHPMMQRAIASAQKHNINLEPGRINSGGGNCSYESVIFNINDRSCFPEKFLMSPDVYRRVWNIDTMNKVLDERIPWNPGMTRKQIVAGFQEVMEPGVYEISFFGDMIMAGIACGVRKIILIFNTNPDISRRVHDPVSMVDPRDYGGNMDS